MKKTDLYHKAAKLGISQKETSLILEKTLDISSTDVFLLETIDEKYISLLENMLFQRANWTPLEYIINRANFFSLDFFVDNRVLIPRNDTEILVEQVLSITDIHEYTLIDVGTGSWAIPISILKNSNLPHALALDISPEALEVTKKNLQQHRLKQRLTIQQSNLLTALLDKKDSKIAEKNIIITANLPYIKNGDFANMSKETIQHEPHLALFGGQQTGFELYETLIFQIFELAKLYKIEKILLFIEIGFDQKEIAETFLQQQKLPFTIYKDNNWIERCVKIIFDFTKNMIQ